MDQLELEGARPVAVADGEATSRFVARVFLWIGAGLVVSAATAAWVGTDDALYEQLWVDDGVLKWVVLFAPLTLILVMGFAMRRLSVVSMAALYVAFTFTQGLTLAFVFQSYSDAAIAQAFGAASAAFVGAGVVGFVTKRDLSRLGMVLLVGLIGLLAASLVNLLWASSTLYWIVTYGGVLLFTLLTAYDVWWVKKIGSEVEEGATKQKLALWGAVSLYLDFVNLLLFFLRIFGGRG